MCGKYDAISDTLDVKSVIDISFGFFAVFDNHAFVLFEIERSMNFKMNCSLPAEISARVRVSKLAALTGGCVQASRHLMRRSGPRVPS